MLKKDMEEKLNRIIRDNVDLKTMLSDKTRDITKLRNDLETERERERKLLISLIEAGMAKKHYRKREGDKNIEIFHAQPKLESSMNHTTNEIFR